MTQVAEDRIGELRADMDGPVIVAGDRAFDAARRVWNAGINRYPIAIARCESTEDVVSAVTFARAHGLEIAVRGGAHNTAGTAVCDGGLMIDLSPLDEVIVDPERRLAAVGGGALLADLDAATQACGLAVPAGLISHTGVGGLTLGGGMGWLTRRFGLSIDNLVSAEVVTADGHVVRASDDEHPDLFWAIRGGGGNFGVVTSFTFRLHEVDPIVDLGLFFWPLDQGAAALRLARDVVARLPADVNAVVGAISAPPAPFVPEQHHFAPGYVLLLSGFDASTRHAEIVADIRRRLPPLFDLVAPRCPTSACNSCSTRPTPGARTPMRRAPTSRTCRTR
jgi:FAD/FMN-containing dehydrogenase